MSGTMGSKKEEVTTLLMHIKNCMYKTYRWGKVVQTFHRGQQESF